jgi:hypothetical protein
VGSSTFSPDIKVQPFVQGVQAVVAQPVRPIESLDFQNLPGDGVR